MDRNYPEQALTAIVAKRPEIDALIRSLPVLGEKEVERRVRCLDQFFRAAENRDRLLTRFERRCLD